MSQPSHRLELTGHDAVSAALADGMASYRECVFNSAALECGSFGGAFVDCHFRDIEWYWGLFSGAVFAGCRFERCIFRGATFQDCRFMECQFAECQFLPDNLETPCSVSRTRLYACRNLESVGWKALFQASMR